MNTSVLRVSPLRIPQVLVEAAERFVEVVNECEKEQEVQVDCLIILGCPEDDEHDEPSVYLHSNFDEEIADDAAALLRLVAGELIGKDERTIERQDIIEWLKKQAVGAAQETLIMDLARRLERSEHYDAPQ
jgi:hypothetical protein